MMGRILDQIVSADTIETVWNIQIEAMKQFGFDRLIYGHTKFATGDKYGDIGDAVILTSHDPDYVKLYVGELMYLNCPMAKWSSQNVGTCSWRLIQRRLEEGFLTPEEVEMMAINEKMEITAGYSISFHDLSLRTKSGLGLAARRGLTQDNVEEIWDQFGDDIQLINTVAHLKISQFPHKTERRPLTQRQSKALQYVADGKTILEVASILEISPATVEKHLRLARKALDVDTTAHAILKASEMNHF